jgi:hypothetical protein
MFRATRTPIRTSDVSQEGVDYVFSVLGSDHPSLIEAFHKREKDGKNLPELLIFNHEVGVSDFTAMAHI